MRSNLVVTSLSCLLLVACVGGSTDTSAEDKERLKAFVLDKAPDNIPTKLDIDFDGKVKLIGYKVEPTGVVKPGGRVKITMYWQSVKKLDEGWNLFTHVLDGSGERVLNIDNVGPIREWKGEKQIGGPSTWQEGKVYVDEQDFTIPANVKTDKIQVTTGVWRENDRLKIVTGPHDRENRGIVANISTGGPAQPSGPELVNTRVPQLRVDKLDKGTKITPDGKLDEEAWKTAMRTGPLLDVATGKPNLGAIPVNGNARVMFDDTNLYLGFEVNDTNVVGGFDTKQKDPHLWTKDTVEIMVDPDGDGDNKDYYEIQVNPQGLVFDSHFEDYNLPKKDPDGPFGHQEWESKLKAGVVVNGTIDKPEEPDQGYVVELAIPWKSFSKAKAVPPKAGDIWRINFYVIQENNGVSWSPILKQGNFHKASRFGRMMFAEKGFTPTIPFGPTAMVQPGVPPPAQAGPAPSGGIPLPFRQPGLPHLKLPQQGQPKAPK